ncbi:DsbA family protein [Pedobacter rhizosphaerae]|uniref:Thioredoxin n=1 Tax=Pedobacter rhizosphaerae TaxID=390241 RepID=A0A1H9Q4U7_9SPHI|nr:DsbA family protein [Pedobacter rhizosphaerae]SER55442.1 Thioredoxin [Pedobacter rhizosphaerae]
MSTLKPAVNNDDHIEGSLSAPVEIVEFGDYQCPYCRQAYPIIKDIQVLFEGQIKFIFRNFPLAELHQYAFLAAQSAEAAALQGKFWEMHDAIYENQARLSDDLFLELAGGLGLDLEKFKQDVASAEVKEKVEGDFESGVRSGVNGTPSFYVNGEKFDGGAIDLRNMLNESAE